MGMPEINMNMRARSIAIFCLIFFSMANAASAATYYVAKTGNDANAGTETSPFLTLQKAANVAVAGDIVYIKAGTYKEQVTLKHSGSAGNYITFQNYMTDIATISYPGAGNYVVSPDHSTGLFQIAGVSYIKVKGLRFADTAMGITMLISNEAHHIIVDGNNFDNVSGSALYIGYWGTRDPYFVSDITIINNRASRAPKSTQLNEFFSFDGVNNANISYNTIDYVSNGWGIVFKNGGANAVISNNVIHDVFWKDNSWFGYLSAAIYVDGSYSGVTNVSVSNNLAWNVEFIGVGSECGGLVKNVKFYNNILIGAQTGYQVPNYHNNILCPSAPGPKYEQILFVNNVAYNSNISNGYGQWYRVQVSQPDIILRNNIGYGTGKNFIASGVTQDHNSWNLGITDPKFVNPAAKDFRLQAGSPAIDKGTSVGAPAFDFVGAIRPAGAGFDIGAYEYGSTSSCTPNWKCESPFNGYESDGCGNRRTNSACTSSNPSPTCTDGVKNGAETGVDCGGPCPACASNPPMQLTLKPGWNQISSPIAAGIDLPTIESSCTILPYKTYKLWAWNAQTQTWINPAKVDPLKGYWIYAAYACTVPLSGTPATFTSLPLTAGWNKISARGTFSAIQGTCAGRITGNWVWNWDKAAERWVHPATMELGKGYWIKVDQNCVLGG